MPTFFYILPILLSLSAIAVVRIGWPYGSRYRSPRRFRVGLLSIAMGLVFLWLLPVCVALAVKTMELKGLLILLCLVVAGSVATGGVECIRRANQTPSANQWEGILSFLDRP